MFLPKLGQHAVDVLIFGGPPRAMLRLEDVILGVVDDLVFGVLGGGGSVDGDAAEN